MKEGLEILKMAVSVLLTVALISIAIYVFQNSKDAVTTGVGNMNETTKEWDESDMALLSSAELTGSEVANLIRKHMGAISVQVETVAGGNSTYDSINPFINAKGSTTYVNPTSIFSCKVNRNANGVVSGLSFTEQSSALVTEVNTQEDAKRLLVERLGGIIRLTDTWDTVAEKLQSEIYTDGKTMLKNALGSSSDSWGELVKKAVERINSLEAKLDQANNESLVVPYADGTVLAGESVELGFVPATLILMRGPNDEVQIYRNGSWFTGEGEGVWVTLDNEKVRNNSIETIKYVAYRR